MKYLENNMKDNLHCKNNKRYVKLWINFQSYLTTSDLPIRSISYLSIEINNEIVCLLQTIFSQKKC